LPVDVSEGNGAMGVYVVSGSSSGMGLQAAEKLRAAGHTVIGVDVKAGEGEVKADLSSHAGRRQAVVDIVAAAGNRLDGAVLAAGIGPTPGPDSVRRIF